MIIPVYHIITAQYPIAATTTIEPGMVVSLDTNGYAVKCDANGSYTYPIGLSADRNRAAEAFEWQNRLSDMGNQTAASGMLSVYMGGGEFYLDVDDSTITTPGGTSIEGVIETNATTTPGTPLYTSVNAGRLTHTQTASQTAVAVVTEPKNELASGIPGEWEPGSSVAYVDDASPRQFVKVKLLI